MKARAIPSETVQKIIKLREQGASWQKIENETKIPRRTAKRAYEQLSKEQLKEDAKKARSNLVIEEVRKHIDEIVELAQFIADHLEMPSWVEIEKGSSAYLDNLLRCRPFFIRAPSVDYGYYIPEKISEMYLGVSTDKSTRRLYRENKMLYQALEVHIQQSGRRQGLDGWQHAWNECKVVLKTIHKRALETIDNALNQDKDLRRKIVAREEHKIRDKMADLVVEALWQAIKSEQILSLIETVTDTGRVRFGETLEIELGDNELAIKVAEICNRSVTNLYKGTMKSTIETLREKAQALRESIERAEDDYNRLVLRPVILSTRCKLCL